MRMSLGPPGAAGAHPVCALPACLPSATRQDTEPVNHDVAATLWFPVVGVSTSVKR